MIEASLNRVSLVPGRSQFSLWALLKGLVVVTAFVIVTSLIARAVERHVMRLDQLAVSTRVGDGRWTQKWLRYRYWQRQPRREVHKRGWGCWRRDAG